MSDVPDLAEEIDRKAIEELQRIMHGITARRVGIVAAHASLQTMWATLAGLVAPETMKLIGESATTVEKALNSKSRPEEVAVFIGPSAFAVAQRLSDRVIVMMGSQNHAGQVNGRTLVPPIDSLTPEVWVAEKFKTACSTLGSTLSRIL